MPHLVKCLTDVEECAGAILFCFRGCVDDVAQSMYCTCCMVECSCRKPNWWAGILCVPVVGSNSIGE
jgi:hypothetical protein